MLSSAANFDTTIMLMKTQGVSSVLTNRQRAVPLLRQLVAAFPPRRPGFEPMSGHVEFMVGKVALGQVTSVYFGFPYQSFHRLLHTKHHPSSAAGTIVQMVADVPSGLSLTPPQETKKRGGSPQ
jgi:hypothetical protein